MNNATRLLKKLLFMLAFVAMFFSFALTAFASDFKIEKYNQSETEKLLGKWQIKPISKLPEGRNISNFDVNEKGEIAISFNDISTVAVLNSDGKFLYGYEIKTYGSIYAEMGKEHVNIITVRGRNIVSIDDEGNILSVGKIESDANYPRILTKRSHTVGNETFRLSNRGIGIFGFLSGGYSKIERYNELNDETTIIFDVAKSTILRVSLVILGISIFIGSLSVIAFFDIRKRAHKAKSKQQIITH